MHPTHPDPVIPDVPDGPVPDADPPEPQSAGASTVPCSCGLMYGVADTWSTLVEGIQHCWNGTPCYEYADPAAAKTSSALLDAVETLPDPGYRPVDAESMAPGLRDSLCSLAMNFGPLGLRRAVEYLFPDPDRMFPEPGPEPAPWNELDVEFRAPLVRPVELPGGHFVNPE